MIHKIHKLAEENGFYECIDGYRKVQPGRVTSLILNEDNSYTLRHTDIENIAEKETQEVNLTIDEAKGFLKAVGAKDHFFGYEGKKKVTYNQILKKMNPEHWHSDTTIGNRYSLPMMGGKDHDEEVVGKLSDQEKRVSRLAGKTFWSRPKVEGGYIDDKQG